jgi:polyphosphate kinase 2 (PPK2 family)
MKKKDVLHGLYVELVKLQKEIISSGLKLLIILEGRDAAGKDGTVKVITRHLSPRDTRVVALGKPSDHEAHEWYFQRYTRYLPAAGEFVIFNRSWYNRAGVEKVMGFCSDKEYHSFFKDVELFEQMLVNSGFIILKYYLEISKEEQKKRLNARDEMLLKTSFNHSPWFIVDAEDKDAAHIALIAHLLRHLDYTNKDGDLLARNHELVMPATPENIKEKMYK